MPDSQEEEIKLRIETALHQEQIESMSRKIEKRWVYEDKQWTRMDQRLDKIEAELSLYKTVIKFGKAVALTVAAVLAFKFGDIKGFWK